MRLGEIVTAGVLALLSIYLMWKSTALNIGYVPGRGPGGGAWPFWLATIMLGCTVAIGINWARRTSPPSRSTEPVLDRDGRRMLLQVGGGLLGFVALIDIISMYGAMGAFLFYYLWFLGRHSIWMSLLISTVMPIAFFFFFEGVMRMTMPTGMSFTDPVFNVLYEIIY